MGIALLAGVSATLLLSTAVFAADAIEPVPEIVVAGSGYALTVGGGVVGYNLPDFELPLAGTSDGLFEDTLTGPAYGGIVGLSLSTQLDSMGDYASSLNASGFISFASRNSSFSHTLGADDDGLIIRGLTTPDGVIALTTDPATPAAAWDINATFDALDQDGSAPANAGGAQNASAANEPGDGFSFGGAATLSDVGGNAAYAFGALATEDGGIFLATGDLEGWVVDTDVTQNLIYLGGDLTFALSSAPGTGELAVTAYAGPSYRFLGTETTTNISVDVAEIQPTTPDDYAFPTYTQSTVEDLGTHYIGSVAGASISIPVSSTASLTLGAEGGLYYAKTSYDATETYELSGGNIPVNGTTVANAIGVSSEDEGFAYAVRTQGTFTTAVSDTMQVSLGLGAEYLSKVATITRDTSGLIAPTGSPGDVEYAGPDSANASIISFGDAWSWTATVALTGQF